MNDSNNGIEVSKPVHLSIFLKINFLTMDQIGLLLSKSKVYLSVVV